MTHLFRYLWAFPATAVGLVTHPGSGLASTDQFPWRSRFWTRMSFRSRYSLKSRVSVYSPQVTQGSDVGFSRTMGS